MALDAAVAAHVELLEDHAVVRRPLALMQRGDDASHQSPGAAHVLLIGVVDVPAACCILLGGLRARGGVDGTASS